MVMILSTAKLPTRNGSGNQYFSSWNQWLSIIKNGLRKRNEHGAGIMQQQEVLDQFFQGGDRKNEEYRRCGYYWYAWRW